MPESAGAVPNVKVIRICLFFPLHLKLTSEPGNVFHQPAPYLHSIIHLSAAEKFSFQCLLQTMHNWRNTKRLITPAGIEFRGRHPGTTVRARHTGDDKRDWPINDNPRRIPCDSTFCSYTPTKHQFKYATTTATPAILEKGYGALRRDTWARWHGCS